MAAASKSARWPPPYCRANGRDASPRRPELRSLSISLQYSDDINILLIHILFMGNNNTRKDRGQIHTPPSWINRNSSFFITINCSIRGLNQLAKEDQFNCIRNASRHYLNKKRWLPELILVMPDHIHAIASFRWRDEKQMSSVIRDLKRYTARNADIQWQRDYFDHRIRSEQDHRNTWSYIMENPVRAGLVSHPDEWEFLWRPEG